jgi:hypothetical protein
VRLPHTGSGQQIPRRRPFAKSDHKSDITTETQFSVRPSFPLLPSVQILFVVFCSVIGSANNSCAARFGPEATTNSDIATETQFSVRPSFPLLPSVQILFAHFCSDRDSLENANGISGKPIVGFEPTT